MNRYNNLNGFRAFCAIGIALMHILAKYFSYSSFTQYNSCY